MRSRSFITFKSQLPDKGPFEMSNFSLYRLVVKDLMVLCVLDSTTDTNVSAYQL